MTKRIIGIVVSAVLVLGVGGVVLAAGSPPRPSYGLEESALAMATDPATAAAAAAPADAKRQELRTCVKTKVDAGGERKAALKECATQLGVEPKLGKMRGQGPAKIGRAAHAELVVPKKGAEGQWETIQVDRGKVTAASADSLSVQRPDGPTVTLKVVAATKVRGAAKAADLAVGREVVVVSAGGEARAIVARA